MTHLSFRSSYIVCANPADIHVIRHLATSHVTHDDMNTDNLQETLHSKNLARNIYVFWTNML